MELPVNLIIVLSIGVMVLVAVGAFFALNSQKTVSTTDAQMLFNDKCREYAAKDCAWSLTRGSDFDSFLQACRQLYGPTHDKFSCLYIECGQCRQSTNAACMALCEEAKSNQRLGISIVPICEQMASECTDYVCEIC